MIDQNNNLKSKIDKIKYLDEINICLNNECFSKLNYDKCHIKTSYLH